MVRLPVLQVDHANHSAPAKDRHGQEGFKGVLGQIVKYLEPGVDGGVGGYSHGLAVFGNPARYPLTYGDSKAIYQIGVRVLRCPQNQLVILPDEDEAGIASDDFCDNVQDTLQDRGKRVGGSDAAADFMERLYIARILQYFGVATHGRTSVETCQPRFRAPPLSLCLRVLSRRRTPRDASLQKSLLCSRSFCLRVSGAVAPSASEDPISPANSGRYSSATKNSRFTEDASESYLDQCEQMMSEGMDC